MEEMEVTERGDMTEAWGGMGQTQLLGQREEMEEEQAAGNLRFLLSLTLMPLSPALGAWEAMEELQEEAGVEGGVGGAGGEGGEGGLGGAPGQCNAQLRVWKAHRNWHEERDKCSHFCTSCSRDDVEDPCSHFARGFPGDCLIESFGTSGQPGAPGADCGEGPQGYPGKD